MALVPMVNDAAATAPCDIHLTSAEEFAAFLKKHRLTRRKRVLMTGSRRFVSAAAIKLALDEHLPEKAVLLCGMADGADMLAADYAIQNGRALAGFPAQWNQLSRSAGPLRNRVMLSCKPDLVIVFSDNLSASTGTRDCAGVAYMLGLPIVQFNSRGDSRSLQAEAPTVTWEHPGLWNGVGDPPSMAQRLFVPRPSRPSTAQVEVAAEPSDAELAAAVEVSES